MTILYPAAAPVKSARRFGAGVFNEQIGCATSATDEPPRPARTFEPHGR